MCTVNVRRVYWFQTVITLVNTANDYDTTILKTNTHCELVQQCYETKSVLNSYMSSIIFKFRMTFIEIIFII